MLKHTCPGLVVFTQGFPSLRVFAQQKFLPSHPLSSSSLWLDEDDFLSVRAAASAQRVANPLRIDPYAHHPHLSRFARAQVSTAASRENTILKAKGTKHKSRHDTAAAWPAATYDTGPQAAGAEAPEQRRAVAGDEARGHKLPFVPELTDGYLGGSTAHRVEDAAPRRPRRGRPPKVTDDAAKQALRAEGVPHYEVPICTLMLTKPLYLFNMDQMCVLSPKSVGMHLVTADSHGKDEIGEYGDENINALPAWPARPIELAGGNGDLAFEVNTPFPRYGQAPMFSENPSYVRLCEHDIAESIRALQLRFPNPVSGKFSSQQSRVMCSIFSRRPYSAPRQYALSILARRHGYRSHWWGTQKQWWCIGVVPQPGQMEHVIPISVLSKIVHISLIEDAANVLQNCFITAKRRRLVYLFSSASAQLGRLESAGDAVVAHARTHASQLTDCLFHAETTMRGVSERWNFGSFSMNVQEDMRVNKWSLPVYFTLQQLRTLKLELRPDAVGFFPAATEVVGGHPSRGSAEAVEAEHGEVSATDREVTMDSAKAASTELWDSRARLAAAAKIPTTENTPTLAWGSAGMPEYWYHISQVHFPDSYLVPSVVLTAELEQPGVPLSGVSGRRLPHRALLYESLVNQHPDVAAAVRGASVADAEPRTHAAAAEVSRESMEHRCCADAQEAAPPQESLVGNQNIEPLRAASAVHTSGFSEIKADEEDLVIARFVATHSSPKLTQGRSLWYQAEDVLAAGGVVDVNSAPIEVMKRPEVVCGGKSTADGTGIPEDGDSSHLPGRVLYNVECLMEPDEALRLLSVPFDPM